MATVLRYASGRGIPVAVRGGGHGSDGHAMPGGALVVDPVGSAAATVSRSRASAVRPVSLVWKPCSIRVGTEDTSGGTKPPARGGSSSASGLPWASAISRSRTWSSSGSGLRVVSRILASSSFRPRMTSPGSSSNSFAPCPGRAADSIAMGSVVTRRARKSVTRNDAARHRDAGAADRPGAAAAARTADAIRSTADVARIPSRWRE
ncbi:hypothetical protein [Streptomyces sp. NPDC059455]|uniref:hypothetical protein n=1 Tax=Streptomyces sp. NPDC059455 TaxID=3346837 RepID=UPI00369541A7